MLICERSYCEFLAAVWLSEYGTGRRVKNDCCVLLVEKAGIKRHRNYIYKGKREEMVSKLKSG